MNENENDYFNHLSWTAIYEISFDNVQISMN